MSTPLIIAEQINSFYGDSHILHDVDFKLHKGETLALMGRNGMGKTTLIKSLFGIVQPKSGSIRILGNVINKTPIWARSRLGIALVPEGRGIFPNLSVRENLIMAARAGIRGQRDWTLERVLTTFPHLKERINYRGWQLSGGEQQMLSIGRALLTNPEVLFLDEACEGLAPLVAHEIWKIIREIRQTGISTVIVDKNHLALTKLADRTMILVKGKVVFDDSTVNLQNNQNIVEKYLGI